MKDRAVGPKLTDLSATLNPSGSRNISLISMALPTDSTLAVSRDRGIAIIDSVPAPHVVDLSWTGNRYEKHLFSSVKVTRGTTEADSTPSKSEANTVEVIPQRFVALLCT